MNESESKKLVDDYIAWLKRGLAVKDVDGACELTTPFLDRHNDHLQIYAVKDNGKIEVTDDGYIYIPYSLCNGKVIQGVNSLSRIPSIPPDNLKVI